MQLGLRCSCGHELHFRNEEVELLKLGIPMLMTCSSCEGQVHVARASDKLATYKVAGTVTGETGKKVNFEYDKTPISTCDLPA